MEVYISKEYLVNEKIRFKEVRVILQNGENLGVIPTYNALDQAQKQGLDLVVIADKANPPVAKILDFNKFLYEERKKESAAKARSRKSELKEFRFGPSIGLRDLDQRIDRAKRFIEDGHRVKVSIKMKGREQTFSHLAFDKAKYFENAIIDIAKPEKEAKLNGNTVEVIFVGK